MYLQPSWPPSRGEELTLTERRTVSYDGPMQVKATATSVTFTVLGNDYFDAAGSTITFDTYQRGSTVYLRQTAVAIGGDSLVHIGVSLGANSELWSRQASALNQILGGG